MALPEQKASEVCLRQPPNLIPASIHRSYAASSKVTSSTHSTHGSTAILTGTVSSKHTVAAPGKSVYENVAPSCW